MSSPAQGRERTAPDAPVVRCLVMPLHGERMLAPSTTVAEVTTIGEVTSVPGAPAWLLGLMSWRGRRVPLVALEGFWSEVRAEAKGRVVVFNTLNGDARMPFVAIPVQGVPRLYPADSRSVVSSGRKMGGLAYCVDLAGEQGVIPDLDELERRLLELPLG